MLRDFNSHTAWHPVVAESEIEGGERADQVGCVRRFTLRDGNRIREQLLALSDRDHVSTYCILDATVPLRRYVATVQLKRVTDGERTFWHWQSTFDAPPGRERELAEMVGTGVYEGGFEGLRAYLRRGRPAPASPRGAGARGDRGDPGSGGHRLRRARGAALAAADGTPARPRRGADPADGGGRQLHRRLRADGPLPDDRAAGAPRHGGGRRGPRRGRGRRAPPARRSRRLRLRAARRLRRVSARCRPPRSWCSRTTWTTRPPPR